MTTTTSHPIKIGDLVRLTDERFDRLANNAYGGSPTVRLAEGGNHKDIIGRVEAYNTIKQHEDSCRVLWKHISAKDFTNGTYSSWFFGNLEVVKRSHKQINRPVSNKPLPTQFKRPKKIPQYKKD